MNAQVVSGIYASRLEAETVRSRLLEHGLPREQVDVVARVRADDHNRPLTAADEVLKGVLMDSAAGAMVGIVIGALAEVALAAANVMLFAASQWIAPVAMLGWGAGLGGIIGAIIGANGAKKTGRLASIVLHAIRSGHVTVLARTRSEEEIKLASDVIGAAIVVRNEQRSAAV